MKVLPNCDIVTANETPIYVEGDIEMERVALFVDGSAMFYAQRCLQRSRIEAGVDDSTIDVNLV